MRTVLLALALVVFVALVVLVGTVLVVRYGPSTRNRSALAEDLNEDLDERLAEKLSPGAGSHLERAPTVRRFAVVDERGGEPVSVPVVRVDLGTTDAPGTRLVFEYVADVLEAVHPVLEARDECVARYDVEFTFGPDGLLVEGECRRVSVPAELADELLENERYRAFDLRRDVERGDGDETAATPWGPCRSRKRFDAVRQPVGDSSRGE